jgi:hypothetical protein
LIAALALELDEVPDLEAAEEFGAALHDRLA